MGCLLCGPKNELKFLSSPMASTIRLVQEQSQLSSQEDARCKRSSSPYDFSKTLTCVIGKLVELDFDHTRSSPNFSQ